MTKKELNAMRALDDAAEEAGGYVIFNSNFENEAHYDYQAISKYCEKKGIEPIDLTESELKQFEVLDIGGGKRE